MKILVQVRNKKFHSENYNCITHAQISFGILIYYDIKTVDGVWGEWSDWNVCTVTCGVGYQSRNRTCDNPLPQFGGDDCTIDGSNSTESQTCNEHPCPSKRQNKY